MCDCYEGECEGCGVEMSIHIGDFSTGQNNVHPWCHKCHDRMLAHLAATRNCAGNESWIVFKDRLDFPKGMQPYKGARRGAVVFFLVDIPRQIHTN